MKSETAQIQSVCGIKKIVELLTQLELKMFADSTIL
jgi:hypothetical protein